MTTTSTLKWLALQTPAGRAALMLPRLAKAWRIAARPVLAAPLWVLQSREYSNYTYDVSKTGLNAMIGAASVVSGRPIGEVAAFVEELLSCRELQQVVAEQHRVSSHRWSTDGVFRPGRRTLYYLLARALKPKLIVEAGVENGLGAAILCEAIRRNGSGEYLGIERDVDQPCALYANFKHRTGQVLHRDAVAAMAKFDRPVDLFFHDTTSAAEHVKLLLPAVKLAPNGVIATSWATHEVFAFAEQQGKRFLQVRDEPVRHWFPGAQMGLVF